MTFEEEWRPHITAARKAEAARYAAAPIAPRYADECDSLDPYREDGSWQFRAAPYWGNPL